MGHLGYALDLPGTAGNYASTPNDDADRIGNRLTKNQSSLEVSVNGWLADVNCAVSRSVAQALDGTASLQMVAAATGDMQATTRTQKSGMKVKPNTVYKAGASFRANGAGRATRLHINWYDAAGAPIGASSGVVSADTNATWTEATVTATSPANAAWAAVVPQVLLPLAGEIHYVDKVFFAAGSISTWSVGREEDLELTIRMQADNWTPPVVADFFNKEDSFILRLQSHGALTLYMFNPANGEYFWADSTQAVSGTVKYIRVKLDVDNGANQRVFTFETSDDGITWTQLGDAIVQTGVCFVPENNKPIAIGARSEGGTVQPFAGRVYSAAVRNSINSDTLVIASPDFNRVPGTISFTDAQGNGWVINGANTQFVRVSIRDYVEEDWEYEYNGLLFGGDTDYGVLEVQGLHPPAKRADIDEKAEQHGSYVFAKYFEPRRIMIKADMVPLTGEDFDTLVNNLERAFVADELIPLKFKRPGRGIRRVNCVPVQGPVFPIDRAFSMEYGVWAVDLLAEDPFIYDDEEQSVTFTPGVGGSGADFSIDFPFNFGGGAGNTAIATNNGTVPTAPVVRLNGPLFVSRIVNETTEESLIFSTPFDLAQGEYVEIDFAAETIMLNGAVSRYNHLNVPLSVFFRLVPGGNTIRVLISGASGGNVVVTWRSAYVT